MFLGLALLVHMFFPLKLPTLWGLRSFLESWISPQSGRLVVHCLCGPMLRDPVCRAAISWWCDLATEWKPRSRVGQGQPQVQLFLPLNSWKWNFKVPFTTASTGEIPTEFSTITYFFLKEAPRRVNCAQPSFHFSLSTHLPVQRAHALFLVMPPMWCSSRSRVLFTLTNTLPHLLKLFFFFFYCISLMFLLVPPEENIWIHDLHYISISFHVPFHFEEDLNHTVSDP